MQIDQYIKIFDPSLLSLSWNYFRHSKMRVSASVAHAIYNSPGEPRLGGKSHRASELRRWSAHWIACHELPENKRGQSSHSFINDEDVQQKLILELRKVAATSKTHSAVHPIKKLSLKCLGEEFWFLPRVVGWSGLDGNGETGKDVILMVMSNQTFFKPSRKRSKWVESWLWETVCIDYEERSFWGIG